MPNVHGKHSPQETNAGLHQDEGMYINNFNKHFEQLKRCNILIFTNFTSSVLGIRPLNSLEGPPFFILPGRPVYILKPSLFVSFYIFIVMLRVR